MFEHELARTVLLEHSLEFNSPEVRFRKEWQALRAAKAEQPAIDLFPQGKELERAA